MANLYSKATGNWTTLGTFNTLANGTGTDTVPTNAHDVVIQSGHTVTQDATTCACKSLTVNSGGTLTLSTSASSKILAENDIVFDGTLSGNLTGDATKIAQLRSNNANSSGSGTISAAGSASPAHNAGGIVLFRYTASIDLRGFSRKRVTTISAGLTANSTKSVAVADATGWQVGDRMIFATTSAYNSTPRTDVVTIATITPGSGTTATVTWTDGIGTGGAVLYDHAPSGKVGNFTSNIQIGPAAAGRSGCVGFLYGSNASASRRIDNVEFDYLYTSSYYPDPAMGSGWNMLWKGANDTGWTSFDSNVFYQNYGNIGLNLVGGVGPFGTTTMARSNTVYYSDQTPGYDYAVSGALVVTQYGVGAYGGTETDLTIFRSGTGVCIGTSATSINLVRPTISGCNVAALMGLGAISIDITDPDIYSCNAALQAYAVGTLNITGTTTTAAKIGTTVACSTVFQLGSGGLINATLTNCNVQSGGTFIANGATNPVSTNVISLVNKNGSVTTQEIYRPYGTIKRDNSNNKRSTSSVAIKPSSTGTDTQYTVSVPCANGATVRVIGYVKADTSFYNGGGSNWTAPTVALSGLGATTQTFTASSAANNAWEQVDLSITNSSGADGNFTLTFTANAKSVTTGTVYFDGMPTSSPFVTKARHYGYLFDQTTPNATANPVISASESTAGGYTGITVTGGTSTSSTVLSASKTFQQLYDYTQAWSCTTANLGYAIPVTGAGVAGSPVLFAAGNLTVNTGYTLSGSGSINMGSYTLTTETATAQSYTYTGGTWSQATTVPTFSGGTLALSAQGTWTFTATGSPIITFAPTSSGVTYAMGGGTFGGTVDLRNTHASRTITVELPSGTTYTTANNTGAAITVSTPQVYQSVTISGATAGSRIQIYDTTSSTELYNGTPSFPYTWTDSNPASATRDIRLRVSYVSGTTAKEFIEANIGTCATSGSGKDVTYLVSQSNDATYNSNGVNGPSIYATSGITFTDASTDLVNCNIPGGSVQYKTIYACFVYWNSTSTGIANDFTYISAPDTANYIFTSMKIRNTSSTDLTVTGGYGRDSSTGFSKDIIDTAGSTGNIFLAPDHVVPYQTSGDYAITGDISTILTAIGTIPASMLSAAESAPIAANIKKVNSYSVTGAGTQANPWNPA